MVDKRKVDNFRKALTSSGKTMVAGKNAEQNEQVIKQASEDEIVLHTKASGSPFVNIKNNDEKTTLKDIHEAAVFCAKYSQVWKKSKLKKDVEVHVFKGKDIFKIKSMKLGTFGVKKLKKIIIKKEELLDKSKEKD